MGVAERFVVIIASLLFVVPLSATAQTHPDLSYRIEAVVDVEQQVIRGQAHLEIPFSLLWSASEIRLDLLSAGEDSLGRALLTVESVGSDREIEIVEDTDDRLRVLLPAAAEPGQIIPLDVRYSCAFNDSYEQLGYYSFWSHEPGDYWYPDVVGAGGARADFKDFQVTIDYPETYTAVTTGIQQGSATLGDGKLRATFGSEHVEGFSLSLGEGFELLELEGEGTTVVGLLPPDEPDAFRLAVELTAEAVRWYRQTYGFFTVQQIGIIPGPRRWSGGFPLPNVFMVHRGNLGEEFLRWITAHELGHYYWGLYVLSATSERLDWLNLANGIWVDHLYLGQTSRRTIEQVLREPGAGDMLVDYLEAMLENREQRLGIPRDVEGSLGFDYNSLIRHGKATVGVYLQARRLGTERFLELQRELLRDYRFKPLPVSEFAGRLEAAGATGAAEFFDNWMRGDARIEFDGARVESQAIEDGWVHRVHISQAGTIPYDLDVELVGADGTRVVRSLAAEDFAESREQLVEDTLAVLLSEVRLDPLGALPMWNSSHIGIRRAFLHAMFRANLTAPFLTLVPDYLEAQPADDFMCLLYVYRLFQLGRHEQVLAAQEPLARETPEEPAAMCATRYSCWAAILLARSLTALDRFTEAQAILSAIKSLVSSHRLEQLWEEANAEISERGSQ
jgi:hypothetical protein